MASFPPIPSWPANETETLLEAACKDPAYRAAFLKSLLSCRLFLLHDPEHPPTIENGVIAGDGQVRLRMIDAEGAPAIIALTSKELLDLSVPQGTPFLELRGEDLFKSAAGAPIAINPMGPYGKLLTREELRALISGMVLAEDGRLIVDEEVPARFAPFANPPTHLLSALERACLGDKNIKSAYLGLVNYSKSGDDAVVLVALECDGDFQAAAKTIAALARTIPDLPQGIIDVYQLSESDFSKLIRAHGLNVYNRANRRRWLPW